MIATEERIKIGYDIHQEERYNNLKEAKISAYNELLEYVKDFVKTSEIDFNTSDLKTEIINKVLAIYKSQFPKIVSDEKVLELIGFMYSKLVALVERFQSIDIEFNTKTKESPIKDFTIYSENSIQAEKYLKFKRLADELNDNVDNIHSGSMIKQQMCHVLNNIIFYNVVNHSFEPNINYIQKLK